MNDLFCLFCLIDIAEIADKITRNELPKSTKFPEVQKAMTIAPMWQTTMMGDIQAVACVTVPACKKHVVVIHRTTSEEAQGANIPQNGHLERGETDAELQ